MPERVTTRITDSTQQIGRQIENMEQQAKSTIAAVQVVNSSFAEETTSLTTHAREAEQQVRSVQATTANMVEQARQARESLQGENDRAAELLSGLVSRLVQSGGQVRDISNTTEASLVSLHTGLMQQTGEISTSMQSIIERQKVLSSALFEQREVMTALLNRLASAQEESAGNTERTVVRFADSTQSIARSIETLNAGVKSALESIEEANSTFAQEANVMNMHAREAEQQARSVASTTSALSEQTRQVRETMQSEGERASVIFADLIGKLTQSGTYVRDVASSTETAMTNLNTGINHQSSEISTAMQQIVERQKVLTAALSEQREIMSSLLNRVAVAQDETASATERTVVRLSDGAQQIVKQLEAIGVQAQGTLTNVQAAGRGIADEAGNLTMQAQQAEQHVRGVVSVMNSLQEQTQKTRDALHNETARVIGDISNVTSQIDLSTMQLKEQSSQAVHAMDQSALQFASLSKISAEAIQTQLGSLNSAAANVTDTLKMVVKSGSDAMQQQATQISSVAESAADKIKTAIASGVDAIQQQEGIIAIAADNVADKLKAVVASGADAMQQQASHINAASDVAKDKIKLIVDLGAQAEQQARQLADVAEYATNRLGALPAARS